MTEPLPAAPGRPPQPVLPGLWAFAPNRDTQGGTAWLLEIPGGGDLLIDSPGLTEANQAFLESRRARCLSAGCPSWLVLTGREGHGRCRQLQEWLDWPVLVQEQEAYLLPGVEGLIPFAERHRLDEGLHLFWTPGPTPGACVLHVRVGEVDGLFCGRLLAPVAPGRLAPLRTSRSFHGVRWHRSLERLREWLPRHSPVWIASGAALGGLRGEKLVFGGARMLDELNRDLRSSGLPSPGP